MRSILTLLVLTFTFSFMMNAQTEMSIKWQKTYGGSRDDFTQSIQLTNDGGFIMAGFSWSNDGDVSGNHGEGDYWVVKTDHSGAVQWKKCYGGSWKEEAYYIQQTTDGGYIFTGLTESNDGDVTGFHGNQDCWVVKTDSLGNIQWEKCYGGSYYDYFKSIKQTTDGGYIFVGGTTSWDGDVTSYYGGYDYWVVKSDSLGVIQWQKSYGGSGDECAMNVQQTTDGGYIISGATESNVGDIFFNHGGYDFWVIKIDPSGFIQWQKTYGGSGEDIAFWGQQTNDGGYIFTGISASNDGDVTGNHGMHDFWVVKTDSLGEIQWQKSYGGSDEDYAWSIHQTLDDGYIITGKASSDDGDLTSNHGYEDYWVVKTDSLGVIQWQKSLGGSSYDEGFSIWQTNSNEYLFAGSSESNDGDVTSNYGWYDYWVGMLCYSDPVNISISDTTYCYSTMLSATGGFAKYLWNTGDSTQSIEVSAGGIYKVIGTNSSGCPSESVTTVPDPVQPYNGQQICMVTLDSLMGKNVIVIEKKLNVRTDSIHIYRMDNLSSLYKLVGCLGNNELSTFLDNEAIPAQQSYQYKISVKDSCGRESGLSAMHRTILLQANTGINHEVNLMWNPYEGFGYSTFGIYRSNAGGEFLLIANVPNTTYSFTDLTPPSGLNLYQIRVSKESPCVPIKSFYNHVSSNVITSSNLGIEENQNKSFTLHPNPASDYLILTVSEKLIGSIYKITDQTGRILVTGKITSETSNINISDLSRDIYTLILGEQNNIGSGELLKQIFSKKLAPVYEIGE